jgi:hypothetical protein
MEQSELEQGTQDVDVAAAGGVRLESVFGGRRKGDTEMARRIVAIALREKVMRRRRRRNANGDLLRGWVTVEEDLTLREIAERAGCSREYARKVINRIIG